MQPTAQAARARRQRLCLGGSYLEHHASLAALQYSREARPALQQALLGATARRSLSDGSCSKLYQRGSLRLCLHRRRRATVHPLSCTSPTVDVSSTFRLLPTQHSTAGFLTPNAPLASAPPARSSLRRPAALGAGGSLMQRRRECVQCAALCADERPTSLNPPAARRTLASA